MELLVTRALRCFLFLDLLAQAFFPGARLWGKVLTEVFGFEDRADFDFFVAEGSPFQPLDGLVHGTDLPEPEAGDQLLGFSERAVDDRALGAIELYALALGTGLQALACQHDTRFDQLLVEFPHFSQNFFARENACL